MPTTVVKQLYIPAATSIDRELAILGDQLAAGEPCMIWRDDGILLWCTFDPDRSLADASWLGALTSALDGWYAERPGSPPADASPPSREWRGQVSRLHRFNRYLRGALQHPLMPFTITRLQSCLWHVTEASGAAGWRALQEWCDQREQQDGGFE